jgi:hypothetical protein
MKKNIVLIVVGLILFGVGFFSGMEYKAYTIRVAFKDVFSGLNEDTSTSQMQEAKKENMQIIEKTVGDEIVLATMNLKVNSVEEKQILNASYGSPKVAKEGTKFAVISLDVTNTTNSEFDFSPDMIVLDNKEREFSTYSDSIGAIDNYLNYQELSPSVNESGFLIYELPNDATNYSLMVAKAGTKELYKIVLK